MREGAPVGRPVEACPVPLSFLLPLALALLTQLLLALPLALCFDPGRCCHQVALPLLLVPAISLACPATPSDVKHKQGAKSSGS